MAATQEVIDFVTVEVRTVTVEDAAVALAHKGSRIASVRSLLANRVDALAEAQRQLDFYQPGRRLYSFVSEKSALTVDIEANNVYAPIAAGPFGFDGSVSVICVNPEETADIVRWQGVA